MTEEEKIYALEAANVLASRPFTDAFAKLDALYITQWRSAKTEVERESVWVKQAVLGDVRRELEAEINAAVVATQGKDERLKKAAQSAKKARK